MATSEEVARLAGVSRATVSRALNGSARVSDEARERVRAAIAALGYEPDVIAQSLVRQRSRVIAVSLFPEKEELFLSNLGQTAHYFYLGVLENIEREAVSLGYDLLLPSRPHGKSPENYIRSLQTRRIAGVISLYAAEARAQALVHSSIPTVFIDRISQGSCATYVKSDNIEGARQVTQYLLALGHRRIALVTGLTTDLSGLERLLGYQQALAEAAITPDAGLVRQSGWNVDEAYESARALLAERHDFTAIVAGSDFMAIGILRALTEQGLRVPEDVSLTGFDDIDFCQYTVPQLTTVRQDRVAMGRGAVQQLIAMIEEKEEISPLVLPTQLVVRNSTGPVPA
ncbi:MAG TPA: LacI family DNA-binding transcriptional regulator [Ktedonobacteraceae bacterium]|nr:LacI family DNA-binding transcriptional regulator [Ktedonobacteraceae bacterium]